MLRRVALHAFVLVSAVAGDGTILVLDEAAGHVGARQGLEEFKYSLQIAGTNGALCQRCLGKVPFNSLDPVGISVQ